MTLSPKTSSILTKEAPIRIVVIDDDGLILRVLQRSLESAGYTVFSTQDGEEALRLVVDVHPQVVICDWQMEPTNGLDICRRIKQTRGLEDIFFFLLTSRSSIEDRVTGLDIGADDFLCKPLVVDELLARVRAAIRLVRANEQLRLLSTDLQRQTERLNQELAQAAAYVHSLLPADIQGSVEIQSRYLPCSELAGDCYDHYWLDEDHLLFYLIDVSGHGLSAALPSISVHNLLRSNAIPKQILQDPASILSTLNSMFQMEKHNCQYFTMWCGVYEASSRQLTYASGGHPPALCFSSTVENGPKASSLTSGGMALGLFEETTYSNQVIELPPGSKILIYSDGAYELNCAAGLTWSPAEFAELVYQLHQQQQHSVDVLVANLRSKSVGGCFRDDCSLIQARFH